MFKRTRALFLLPVLLCGGVPDAVAADRKRPYEVPRDQVEIGLHLIHQKNLAGVSETGAYVPATWTRFHSDSLDWKFEGAFSYVSRRGGDWRSLVAASGFRYWVDGSFNVTPMLRLGAAREKSGGKTRLAYGADMLLQKIFTLDAGGDHRAHRLAVVEGRFGAMAYRGRGTDATSRYGFASVLVSYDWPWLPGGWDANHSKRARLGIGVESQFGPDRAVERLFLAALSLRSEHPTTGRLLHKLDLSAGFGARSQHRVSLGYTRGF